MRVQCHKQQDTHCPEKRCERPTLASTILSSATRFHIINSHQEFAHLVQNVKELLEESCYILANCTKGGVLDTKPSLNLITHHYAPLYSFLLLRFHTMHMLFIWDYTPIAFLITPELDILSCSVQDNSLPYMYTPIQQHQQTKL